MTREKTGKKKLIYLRYIWDNSVQEYSRLTGLSQSQVIENLLTRGDKQFREDFGIGSEEEKSDKERRKAEERAEAIRMGGRQLARYAQKTSEERYMRRILFDDLEPVKDFTILQPLSIWDKIFGRRKDEWQEV